jgi:hypothetical protein
MVRGVNPLRYQEESEDNSGSWIALVERYFIPGMLVAAVLAVAAIQFSSSGGLDGGGSNQSIFYDMGKAMFSLK